MRFNFLECVYDNLLRLRIFEDLESTLQYKHKMCKVVLEVRYIFIISPLSAIFHPKYMPSLAIFWKNTERKTYICAGEFDLANGVMH